MNWVTRGSSDGWGDVDGVSSDSSKSKVTARSFWMPPGSTKRIMFIDGEPFHFFEHSLWEITKSGKDKCICLDKNGIDNRGCPLCDAKMWPAFIGYFTIIDMGDVTYERGEGASLKGWTNSKGVEIQFTKQLYGAKRGSQEKPGVLKTLKRKADQKGGGDLTGTVWDVTRPGEKTEAVGSEFEYIETVQPAEMRRYLLEAGANEEYLNVDVIDYAEAFKPKSYEALERLVGSKPSGSGGRSEGAGYGPGLPAGPEDSDIPFNYNRHV